VLSSVANSSLRLFFTLCFSLDDFSFFLFLRSLLSSSLSLSDIFFLLLSVVFLLLLFFFSLGSSSSLVSSVDDGSPDLRVFFSLFIFWSLRFELFFSRSTSLFALTVFSVFIFSFLSSAGSAEVVSAAFLQAFLVSVFASYALSCASISFTLISAIGANSITRALAYVLSLILSAASANFDALPSMSSKVLFLVLLMRIVSI